MLCLCSTQALAQAPPASDPSSIFLNLESCPELRARSIQKILELDIDNVLLVAQSNDTLPTPHEVQIVCLPQSIQVNLLIPQSPSVSRTITRAPAEKRAQTVEERLVSVAILELPFDTPPTPKEDPPPPPDPEPKPALSPPAPTPWRLGTGVQSSRTFAQEGAQDLGFHLGLGYQTALGLHVALVFHGTQASDTTPLGGVEAQNLGAEPRVAWQLWESTSWRIHTGAGVHVSGVRLTGETEDADVNSQQKWRAWVGVHGIATVERRLYRQLYLHLGVKAGHSVVGLRATANQQRQLDLAGPYAGAWVGVTYQF